MPSKDKRPAYLRTGRPQGRPTKCTPEVIADIAKALESGCTYDDAAILAGINPGTLDEWRFRGEAGEEPFAAVPGAVRLARAKARQTAIQGVRAGVLNSGMPDWKANGWWLERFYPAEFGPQQAVTVKLQKEIDGALDTIKAKLSPDEYQRVLAALAGDAVAPALESTTNAHVDDQASDADPRGDGGEETS